MSFVRADCHGAVRNEHTPLLTAPMSFVRVDCHGAVRNEHTPLLTAPMSFYIQIFEMLFTGHFAIAFSSKK
jgi:hypothetical protein